MADRVPPQRIREPGTWQRASPLAIVFFIGKTIRNYAQSLVQLAVTFGALALLILRNPYLFLLIPLGVLAIIAGGVLQYWFFRFRIDDDRILIRQGVLKRTSLDLPFERVQGINVERSLIDRTLGLVTVSLDTSGSAAAEGQLPSVNSELAELLRVRVGASRKSGRADGTGAGGRQPADVGDEAVTDDLPERAPARDVLLRLTGGDMVRIGFSNRNLLFLPAILGMLSELMDTDAAEGAFDSVETAFAGMDDQFRTSLVIGLVLAALALVLGLVIGSAFLRYHDFTLWREGTTFRSRAGLLTQKEVVVDVARIQQLTLVQSLLMRIFRRYRLRALPAALLAQLDPHSTVPGLPEVLEIPALKGREAEDLRAKVFNRAGDGLTLLPGSRGFVRISPRYVLALMLRICTISALAGAVILIGINRAEHLLGAAVGTVIWWLLSIPPAVLIAWQLWRRRGYVHDDDGLASRTGFIGRKVDAFQFRKAQSVTVRQSPLQRRKGLATLDVHLASGKISVPYMNFGVAGRLRDYMLYMAESSRTRWH